MHDSFFRTLTPTEETDFRQWARDNYTPGTEVNELWHPTVRDECARINAEQKHCDECNAEAGEKCRPYCTCWGCVSTDEA